MEKKPLRTPTAALLAALSLPPALAGAPLPEVMAAEESADAELLALFDYDEEADLDVEDAGMNPYDGGVKIDLSYASPGGGRVPAFLHLPDGEGPHAGMLLMHGMPGDRRDGEELARRYCRAGAAVLAISAPWARPDGPRERVLSLTEQDRAEQIQLIQDLRRGVDLLLSFPEVDPARLGYVGISYGGAMGGLLAGVEHRVKAFALVVGDGGLVAHSTGEEDEVPPPGLDEARWQAWLDAMNPIEPIRFVRYAAPSHLLFQNGETDQLVPPADARAYQAAASEPKTILWYEGGHGLDEKRITDQMAWMAERIGIRL